MTPTPTPTPTRASRRRPLLRPWVRAVHRDLGYVSVGLTFVYALSGLAVNHIADWDPNFHDTSRTVQLGPLGAGADDAIAARVTEKVAIDEKPEEVYREGGELEILFKHRTLHVDTATGRVLDEQQKPRLLLRVANWLHLNRGKKAWTYFADGYAAGLLVLATSGLFMIGGKKGLIGRGAIFVGLGILAPVLYVTLSGGP